MFSSLIRTLIMYLLVIAALRIMGKRQVGDMQPNELVITLLLSEIATIPIQDATQPIINGVTAVLLLVIVEILISVLAMKSFRLRRLIGGRSILIIKNGIIDQQAMRDVRLTVIDLIEQLRKQDVFNIEQVDWAVLETSGDLSVRLKSQYETLTPKTLGEFLNDQKTKESLPLPVISDGHLIRESLSALDLSTKDINRILNSKKAKVTDVFLMTCDRFGNHNVILKGGGV